MDKKKGLIFDRQAGRDMIDKRRIEKKGWVEREKEKFT